ncbi:hypothetical protein Vadar_020428 [Vaccinium darrowii]|uniref:Uncharacterized protein n=1 Tax=Vaccinium darrowii TaxID=229202 RepID=A0ACB7ZDZ7_9ERIC|nr:hypothetical protein Vadar_020428 [Vaccinium darrowii]
MNRTEVLKKGKMKVIKWKKTKIMRRMQQKKMKKIKNGMRQRMRRMSKRWWKKEKKKRKNAIKQEEEKVRADSKEEVQRSRKRDINKKMEEEEDEDEGEENEENTNINKQEKKKVGANSGEKVKRSRKRDRKNKMAGMGSKTLATKAEDKPGPLEKKKASKRAESMGMIFMCSSKTKKDCYHYNVLGLLASKREIVQKIYKGMRLFLYDFDLKLMHGIYKVAGPGGFNIEPKAFNVLRKTYWGLRNFANERCFVTCEGLPELAVGLEL